MPAWPAPRRRTRPELPIRASVFSWPSRPAVAPDSAIRARSHAWLSAHRFDRTAVACCSGRPEVLFRGSHRVTERSSPANSRRPGHARLSIHVDGDFGRRHSGGTDRRPQHVGLHDDRGMARGGPGSNPRSPPYPDPDGLRHNRGKARTLVLGGRWSRNRTCCRRPLRHQGLARRAPDVGPRVRHFLHNSHL